MDTNKIAEDPRWWNEGDGPMRELSLGAKIVVAFDQDPLALGIAQFLLLPELIHAIAKALREGTRSVDHIA